MIFAIGLYLFAINDQSPMTFMYSMSYREILLSRYML